MPGKALLLRFMHERRLMDLNDYFDDRFVDFQISQLARNYLAPAGWFLSLRGEPVDASGPIPYITYPALAMLRRIVTPDLKVFEYGSGFSTLWWSRHVKQVVSVDHNHQWIEKIRPSLPANVTVVHQPIGAPTEPGRLAATGDFFAKNYALPTSGNPAHDVEHGLLSKEFTAYATEILHYPVGHFDVVVVDGMARVLTAYLAARQLGPQGIVLFDNSDRWQYNAAYQLLTDAGFARSDFYGPGPVNTIEWCTSLFMRDLGALRRNALIGPDRKKELGW